MTQESPEESYHRQNLGRVRRIPTMDKTMELQGTASLSGLPDFSVIFLYFNGAGEILSLLSGSKGALKQPHPTQEGLDDGMLCQLVLSSPCMEQNAKTSSPNFHL